MKFFWHADKRKSFLQFDTNIAWPDLVKVLILLSFGLVSCNKK